MSDRMRRRECLVDMAEAFIHFPSLVFQVSCFAFREGKGREDGHQRKYANSGRSCAHFVEAIGDIPTSRYATLGDTRDARTEVMG